jgi:hypothetical protein
MILQFFIFILISHKVFCNASPIIDLHVSEISNCCWRLLYFVRLTAMHVRRRSCLGIEAVFQWMSLILITLGHNLMDSKTE